MPNLTRREILAMRSLLICGTSLCLFVAAQGQIRPIAAQSQVQRPFPGVIYGTAVRQDGSPAKGLKLSAMPLGVALAMALPWTKTNDAGEFRFEHLELGRYTVYAEDKEAGYSMFTTVPRDLGTRPEVELTPEHPAGELDVHLPPPAGFLRFHLTNRNTGFPLSGIEVTVTSADATPKLIFSGGFSLPDPILVPSDRDLLLHVTSWGFREWEQTVGAGKHIRIAPGNQVTLDVQLEPSNSITARIPAADEKKYQGVSDGKAWRNPYLVVTEKGIEIAGVSNAGGPLTIDAAVAALENLPDSAWPYGRVVAIQEIGVVSSDYQHPHIVELRDKLSARLGELGVIVGLWPSA